MMGREKNKSLFHSQLQHFSFLSGGKTKQTKQNKTSKPGEKKAKEKKTKMY